MLSSLLFLQGSRVIKPYKYTFVVIVLSAFDAMGFDVNECDVFFEL